MKVLKFCFAAIICKIVKLHLKNYVKMIDLIKTNAGKIKDITLMKKKQKYVVDKKVFIRQ